MIHFILISVFLKIYIYIRCFRLCIVKDEHKFRLGAQYAGDLIWIVSYCCSAKISLMLPNNGSCERNVMHVFKTTLFLPPCSVSFVVANSLGVESPIHNSIHDTHHCFNECASYMLDEVSSGPGRLILAAHNLESGRMAARKAHDLGIGKDSYKLEFASLRNGRGNEFWIDKCRIWCEQILASHSGPFQKSCLNYLLREFYVL
ncbi:hypothetical protein QVD17_36744 [Tagetes erecta]|uniref:Proline dehydrogenase n=1 Tax=Tagetes erecta TaxID=13708 RepID=A0AAD8NHL9_TARER|nr:hypothetical protein QVD17_36744 [Tagetes erecta]